MEGQRDEVRIRVLVTLAQEDLLLGGLDPQMRHPQYLGEQQRAKLVRQQQPDRDGAPHRHTRTHAHASLSVCVTAPCASAGLQSSLRVRGWVGSATYGERDHFSMKTGSSRRMQYPGGLSSNRFTAPKRNQSEINISRKSDGKKIDK